MKKITRLITVPLIAITLLACSQHGSSVAETEISDVSSQQEGSMDENEKAVNEEPISDVTGISEIDDSGKAPLEEWPKIYIGPKGKYFWWEEELTEAFPVSETRLGVMLREDGAITIGAAETDFVIFEGVYEQDHDNFFIFRGKDCIVVGDASVIESEQEGTERTGYIVFAEDGAATLRDEDGNLYYEEGNDNYLFR